MLRVDCESEGLEKRRGMNKVKRARGFMFSFSKDVVKVGVRVIDRSKGMIS
jgi:hypothetical protein